MPGSGATTVEHQITGLTNGTVYKFKIRAVNGNGNGAASDEVTATPNPVVAPVLTAATSTTNRRVTLTWTHAGSTPEDYITGGYRSVVYWKTGHRLKGTTTWQEVSANISQVLGDARRTLTTAGLGYNYPNGALVEVAVRAVASSRLLGRGEIKGPWSNARTVTYMNTDTNALTITGAPVTVAPGSTATYTVALTKAFAGTLSVTSDDTTAARVSPASLTFTTGNYNTARTVTVTGVTNGTATINHAFRLTGASADAIPDAGTVDVTVADAPGVTVSTATLTVVEGSSGSYTMRLNTAPSSDVTITVAGASGDVTVMGSPLTFTTSNWNMLQTVTVTAGTDTDTTTDADVTLTHSASGGDYGSVTIASVVVSVAEKDAVPERPTGFAAAAGNRQVTLSWTDPDNPTITQWQYRQKVGGGAWGEWTDIGGSGAATTRYEVSGLDNGTAYQFEVRAVNGAGNGAGPDAPVSATPMAPATSTPTPPATPPATTTAGVTVTPTTLTVAEGSDATYTVALDTQPSGEVTVTISGASGDVTTNPASLTFTSANYNTAQTVTVTAAEDEDAVTDPAVTLTHSASGGGYSSVSIASVVASVVERGVAPAKPTGLSGAAGDGSVTLSWTDPDNPTITQWQYRQKAGSGAWGEWMDIGGSDDETTSHEVSGLTNGTAYQFEVRAVNGAGNGAGPDAPVSATPTAPATSTPTPPTTPAAGVTVTPTALTVAEGDSGSYTVALNTQPSGNVTVTVTVRGASGDVTTSPASLTFTSANYATAQTVTVTAAEDDDAATDPAVTLTHSASGGGYGSVSIDAVAVTIRENDEAAVTLSVSSLTIQEGSSGNYTVVLDSRPTDEVTVTIGGASGDVSVQPASLTFTPANYATAQTVTVTAAEDEDAATESAVTLTHRASGGDYDAVSIAPVTVTVLEDDEATVTLSRLSLALDEGNSGRYTVVLDSQPVGGEVTVTPGAPIPPY